jgi:hypothetical protein
MTYEGAARMTEAGSEWDMDQYDGLNEPGEDDVEDASIALEDWLESPLLPYCSGPYSGSETQHYRARSVEVSAFPNFPGVESLFHQFSPPETLAIAEKIATTRTLPRLPFVPATLQGQVAGAIEAPFWLMPFAILNEDRGGMLVFDPRGLWSNTESPAEFTQLCDVRNIQALERQALEERLERLTVRLSGDEVLTIDDIPIEYCGTQLAIVEAIWDAWEQVVRTEDRTGIEQCEFDSWWDVSAWATDGPEVE